MLLISESNEKQYSIPTVIEFIIYIALDARLVGILVVHLQRALSNIVTILWHVTARLRQ